MRITKRAFLLLTVAALLSSACLRTRTPSIATNTPAPAFTLPDSANKQVSLANLTAKGPAVITFYRGYW